jgi:hypothetical protein
MNISEQDYELLSAYLDGMLGDSERAELEARLEADSVLRDEFNAMYQTVQLVKSLPELAAPRSYTLTPEQALRIRNERISRPVARENRILRFVLPVLSAASSMALVLFGLSMLLTSQNASPTSGNVAFLTTQSATVSAGASQRYSAVTPTVSVEDAFSATQPEIAAITVTTEELTIEPFASEPLDEDSAVEQGTLNQAGADETADADGAAANDTDDQLSLPAPMATMPMTSIPFDATTEATAAPGGIFGDLFNTSEDDESNTGGAAADESASDAASDMSSASSMAAAPPSPTDATALDEAPFVAPLMITEELEAEAQILQKNTLTDTPLPTATVTASASPTTSPTAAATMAVPTAEPTRTRDVSDASPPSQLIGLVLVGLGLSLGVITLVIARRVASQ